MILQLGSIHELIPQLGADRSLSSVELLMNVITLESIISSEKKNYQNISKQFLKKGAGILVNLHRKANI